jgi:hypothetical protein
MQKRTSERWAPGRPKPTFLIANIEEKYDLSASEGLFFTVNYFTGSRSARSVTNRWPEAWVIISGILDA